MFKVVQHFCEGGGCDWQIIADYGNPLFEPGTVVECGYSERESAAADIERLMREHNISEMPSFAELEP